MPSDAAAFALLLASVCSAVYLVPLQHDDVGGLVLLVVGDPPAHSITSNFLPALPTIDYTSSYSTLPALMTVIRLTVLLVTGRGTYATG